MDMEMDMDMAMDMFHSKERRRREEKRREEVATDHQAAQSRAKGAHMHITAEEDRWYTPFISAIHRGGFFSVSQASGC